jgi:hypothetical protein
VGCCPCGQRSADCLALAVRMCCLDPLVKEPVDACRKFCKRRSSPPLAPSLWCWGVFFYKAAVVDTLSHLFWHETEPAMVHQKTAPWHCKCTTTWGIYCPQQWVPQRFWRPGSPPCLPQGDALTLSATFIVLTTFLLFLHLLFNKLVLEYPASTRPLRGLADGRSSTGPFHQRQSPFLSNNTHKSRTLKE